MALTAVATLALTGCSSESSSTTEAATADGEVVSVLAEVYPLAWIAEQVGGDRVAVGQLVPNGASAHDVELSPAEVNLMGSTDLVIYVDSLATSVDEAIDAAPPAASIDLAALLPTRPGVADDHADEGSEGEDHSDPAGIDPHLWLDPKSMVTVSSAVAEQLSTLDPEGATTYAANAEKVNAELQDLAQRYADGLATCTQKTVFVTHPAFGYLTDAYGLTQVGVSGIDEDTEPSPARLSEITEQARSAGATTIFFADSSNPKIAEALADDLGVQTQELSTIVDGSGGEGYPAIAEQNLTALRDGLDCS